MSTLQNGTSPERFIALDVMKTLAIFLMVLGHVVIMYGSPAAIASDLTRWLAFTTEGIGAPAFIFAMGASIMLSSHKSPMRILQRGVLLFVVGYILNLLKFYPTIALFGVFPQELFVETGRSNDVGGLVSFILIADILQFAAIAYVICAFLQPWVSRFRPLGVLLAIPFLLLAPMLYERDASASNYLLQLIYGKNYQVYFPLFPWLGFALMGMSVGSWIGTGGGKKKTLLIGLPIAGIILIAGGVFLILRNAEQYFGSDYYHRGIGALLMYSGQLLLLLPLYHLLDRIFPIWMRTFFVYCSRNVTRIYIVQWVLIYWCWAFIPYGSQPWSRLWIYFLLFTVISLSIAGMWEYLLRSGKPERLSPMEETPIADPKT